MFDVNELCVIVRLTDVGVINRQVSGVHQINDVSQPRQWNKNLPRQNCVDESFLRLIGK